MEASAKEEGGKEGRGRQDAGVGGVDAGAGTTTSAGGDADTAEDTRREEEVKNDISIKKRPAATADQRGGDEGEPITAEGERPQKKFYRQRAHCNPLSHNDNFDYPVDPTKIDWRKDHYPGLLDQDVAPTVLDVGCGFGGLTLTLAKILGNEERVLGMEIRAKVTEYVRLRIVNARKENDNQADENAEGRPRPYQNCSVLRTNSMKFLANFFKKASINKMFFCFPDPHFKRKNHCRRIVSRRLLSEYAYVLKPGTGRLYCITDVPELHGWHVAECDAHPLFRRIPDTKLVADPCVEAMINETEEGKKVTREGRSKHYAVYERIPDGDAPIIHAGNFFE